MNDQLLIRILQDIELNKKNNSEWLIGMDEVGYGCFAGSLVVGAVAYNPELFLSNLTKLVSDFPKIELVRDSKKLSQKKRNEIEKNLIGLSLNYNGFIYGIGEASVEEINIKGVTEAHNLATQRALDEINKKYPNILLNATVVLDGNKIDACLKTLKTTSLIKGDDLSFAVGSASILAKEYRDRIITSLAKIYPEYGLDRNMGYGTAEHRKALCQFGISPIHRIKYCSSTLNP